MNRDGDRFLEAGARASPIEPCLDSREGRREGIAGLVDPLDLHDPDDVRHRERLTTEPASAIGQPSFDLSKALGQVRHVFGERFLGDLPVAEAAIEVGQPVGGVW
jgi:hypothetical protein